MHSECCPSIFEKGRSLDLSARRRWGFQGFTQQPCPGRPGLLLFASRQKVNESITLMIYDRMLNINKENNKTWVITSILLLISLLLFASRQKVNERITLMIGHLSFTGRNTLSDSHHTNWFTQPLGSFCYFLHRQKLMEKHESHNSSHYHIYLKRVNPAMFSFVRSITKSMWKGLWANP